MNRDSRSRTTTFSLLRSGMTSSSSTPTWAHWSTGHSPVSSDTCYPTKQESASGSRSEEHTSELQSQSNLVCRLLLEKKNQQLPLIAASAKGRLGQPLEDQA